MKNDKSSVQNSLKNGLKNSLKNAFKNWLKKPPINDISKQDTRIIQSQIISSSKSKNDIVSISDEKKKPQQLARQIKRSGLVIENKIDANSNNFYILCSDRSVNFVRNLKYFGKKEVEIAKLMQNSKLQNIKLLEKKSLDYKSMFFSYPDSMKMMNKYVHSAMLNSRDTVWFLEYGNCYTFGLSTTEKDMDFLQKVHVPSYKSNRGGRVTYHGPGQLVVYFIINLRERRMNYSDLLKVIQSTAIDSLRDIGIIACDTNEKYKDAIGIWVKNEKIASIGLRIQNGCSHHGIALNVFPKMDFFDYIVPCGLNGVKMTSFEKLGVINGGFDINSFCDIFEKHFVNQISKISKNSL